MRNYSFRAFLWTMTLLGIASALGVLLLSGQMAYYLHPRSWSAVAAGAVVLAVLSLVSVGQWRSSPKQGLSWGQLLFLLPLVLGLLVPPQTLGLPIVARKGSHGVLRCPGHDHAQPVTHIQLPPGRLIITEQNFLTMMHQLWEAGESLAGREVEMEGFVFSDLSVGPEDFVLARLMMSCCAADAEMVGLLCRWPQRATLEDGQWVRVLGRLQIIPFYDAMVGETRQMPLIVVELLTPIEQPEQVYIYP